MKPRSLAAAVALGLCLVPRPGRSEGSDTIEDLDLTKLLNVEVSTATKTSERADEAPAIITVVTREDIQRWGYQSVAEVLTHTLGFYLIDDHILPNVAVRGMSGGLGAESGVIKVMIDGRSVAYRTTSGNWLGVELIPLSSVAQIEIIRGPASALYGADAFLGVVNIITLKPEDLRPMRARATAGVTEGNPGGRFDVAGGSRAGSFDFLFGAAGESSDRSGLSLPEGSQAPTLPTNIGARRTALNLERRSLVLQGRVATREADLGQLVLSGYGSGLKRGGDFAHWAQLTGGTDAAGEPTGTVVALGQYRLNLSGLLHLDRELDLSVESTYFRGGVLPSDRVEIASDLFYIERKESYRGVDSVAEVRWLPSSRLNLIGGVEAVYNRERIGTPERVNRTTGESVLADGASDRAIALTNVGSYVSSNFKVVDPWLKLTGGLRHDRHSDYGEQLSGRLGATSRLSQSVVLKVLYGGAFKAPSPRLAYASPLRPGDVIGNPDLKPQRVHTVDSQLSWNPVRFFSIASGVSYNWLLDKAEFTPQGINQTARNVASQRSLSWETQADVRHYHDYTAYASFELVRSKRDLGQEGYAATLVGSENVVYPSWIGRGGFTVGIPSLPQVPIELGAKGVLVGRRRAADTSIVERGSDFTLPPYLLLDTALSTREVYLISGHETRFALRSRNLLVSRGPDPGFSGFEYPLTPAELFLEIEHTY